MTPLEGPRSVDDSPSSGADLQARGLSVRFDRNWALQGVDLALEPGQVHGLVGHNGSGKSTFIKVLAGYHQPTEGTVTLGDELLAPGTAARSFELGLRFVHQDLGLVDQFSALENFGIGGRYSLRTLRTIDWRSQRTRLTDVLQTFKVTIDIDVPVGELAAVERSLIAIARAVGGGSDTAGTKFLILDEPTTALESTEIAQLFRVVRELSNRGVGVLFVSHQLKDVLDLCDVISVLRNGRLAETTPSSTATHQSLVEALISGEPPAEKLGSEEPTEAIYGAEDEVGPSALAVTGLRSTLLRGVDVDLRAGECVCVLGLSGSGREELVYAIAGSVPATSELMSRSGRRIRHLTPRSCITEGVALVPGNRMPGSLVADFTMRENLTLTSLRNHTRRIARIDRSRERQAAQECVDRFAIRPADVEYLTTHLSGGNKQKVVLAKWLAIRPKVMLIDEPTAGVDIGVARSIASELRRLVAAGMSILVTTSEIDDALALADRVIVVSHGRVAREIARSRGELTESHLLSAMTAGAPDDQPREVLS